MQMANVNSENRMRVKWKINNNNNCNILFKRKWKMQLHLWFNAWQTECKSGGENKINFNRKEKTNNIKQEII